MSERLNMTLGAFIAALKTRPQKQLIQFDFGYFAPTEPASYRGFYDHLAFGYEEAHDRTVEQVLRWARHALGSTYEGYKGGDFVMRKNTPLWAANWSDSPNSAIVGVRGIGDDGGYLTIVETAYVEW